MWYIAIDVAVDNSIDGLFIDRFLNMGIKFNENNVHISGHHYLLCVDSQCNAFF